jgi:hypothetical protein
MTSRIIKLNQDFSAYTVLGKGHCYERMEDAMDII